MKRPILEQAAFGVGVLSVVLVILVYADAPVLRSVPIYLGLLPLAGVVIGIAARFRGHGSSFLLGGVALNIIAVIAEAVFLWRIVNAYSGIPVLG